MKTPSLISKGKIISEITLLRLLHPLNAPFPMLVTEFGIVMEVRAMQRRKALFPMLVTLFGIVTEVRPMHLLKA